MSLQGLVLEVKHHVLLLQVELLLLLLLLELVVKDYYLLGLSLLLCGLLVDDVLWLRGLVNFGS